VRTTPLPPPGLYPNPSGAPGQRYFDGRGWTPYHRAIPEQPGPTSPPASAPPRVLSVEARTLVLQREIATGTAAGWRVEVLTPTSATLVRYPPRASHLLHFVLSVLTCGLWPPIWLLVAIIEGSRKRVPPDRDGGSAWASGLRPALRPTRSQGDSVIRSRCDRITGPARVIKPRVIDACSSQIRSTRTAALIEAKNAAKCRRPTHSSA
jgi:Protein of unknown function (DUF2510)